jgi:hypothetical protein
MRVIRVLGDPAAESYDLWAVERKIFDPTVVQDTYEYRLRVYKVYTNSTQPSYTDVTLPIQIIAVHSVSPMDPTGSRLSSKLSLAYDGVGNVFMSDTVDKVIHLLSVNGTYERQLVLALHEYTFGETSPLSVSVDCNSNVVHVGFCHGKIVKLSLTYDSQDIY